MCLFCYLDSGTFKLSFDSSFHLVTQVLLYNNQLASANSLEVEECKTPQQKNTFDCGLFALGFAEALTSPKYNYCIIQDETGTKYDGSQLQKCFDASGGFQFALKLRSRIACYIRRTMELIPIPQRTGGEEERSLLVGSSNKNNSPSSVSGQHFFPAITMSISVSITPCLSLHCNDEFQPGFPNNFSCHFNMRDLELTRFGIQCNNVDSNIVFKLRHCWRK